MRLLVALGCGMMLSIAPAVAQQQGPDILKIWQQFSVSNSLASRCAKPDNEKLTKFLANYQIISTHAAHRLKQITPEWSPARIDMVMAEHYSNIDRTISEILIEETCDSQRTKEALQRFDAQADMDLSKSR
ncbi:hypothetical protein [Azospirillum brasilense]|uniref:hypothetical protein n=1 Tax=Azospirillum brasilense TaxID=192 RepID=UPI001EDBEB29|nr:hypothetical protein [Azospirillum brasilense]UKJ75860.1 hypothetical protein H1Q64_16665 [Azospirillum brasilense]